MKNKAMKLTLLSLVVIGGMNMAQAASSVTVNVNGSVSAVTCELGVDAEQINLPVVAPSDFATGAGSIVEKTKQDFKVLTSGCAGTITPTTGQASLKVTAPFTSSGTQYFADSASPDFAIGLMKKGSVELIHNNDLISVGAAGAELAGITNQSTEFTVALINAGAVKPNKAGSVKAPITFDFVYN
ncbi:fimbrial protein [Enterobacter ludwigii]|uniref:fimbrial protein n=1 Tax=Enterobacter ludwigii TaxID=299767 RepID=UPI0013D886F2|nr:fimbrial protein [Enterobacter ludwigii]